MTTVGEQVRCRRPGCGDPYDAHPEGGPCQASTGYYRGRCECPGFFWVDPEAVPVSSYTDPPARP